jgi:alpha-glucosidase
VKNFTESKHLVVYKLIYFYSFETVQWDNTTSSGFSSNAKPWLPVAADYETRNVKAQLAATNSYLKTYKDLRSIRNTNTLKEGSVSTFTFNSNVLVILRELQGNDTYVTVANLGGNQETVNLSTIASSLSNTLEYIVVDSTGSHTKG